MELKNVIKKIMESEDLKSKLKNLDSFDEVYGFFVANGYEGKKQELKEKLFRGSAAYTALTDEDLLNVAGGVSGKQVLSACAGFMMLMGVTPFKDTRGYAITTPLHSAAKDGSFDEVKTSFEKNHSAINEEDENGLTPLHHAVRNKDLDKVKYLVENGADVNARCFREWYNAYETQNEKEWQRLWKEDPSWDGKECGTTPLHDAVEKGDFEIIKYLVEHGADINAQTNLYKHSALHIAAYAENFNMDLIKYLVEHGADINAEDWYGRTALVFALQRMSEDKNDKIDINLIKYLVEHGADVKKEVHGYGMLDGVKDMEVLEYLLQHGADPNTGMWTAFVEHNIELLKYLVEHGADVNKKSLFEGGTPLFLAMDPEWVDYLVKHGADINAKNDYGETPLCNAIKYGEAAVFKCLIERGADINVKNSEGDTLLHMVTLFGGANRKEAVKYLVDHGLDVNAKNDYGLTPLSYAVGNCYPSSSSLHDDEGYREYPEIVRYLIEHGADVNVADENGMTPLVCAHDLDIAKYLVEHGADTTRSLVGSAGYNKHNLDLIKYLVEHGADVNAQSNEGDGTQLHQAWEIEKAKYLVEHGADVNSKTKNGRTPLHCLDNVDVIKYLIENGADVNAKDNKGQTPLDDAISYGFVNKIRCLIQNGADISTYDEGKMLGLAVLFGDADTVDRIIDQGADMGHCLALAVVVGRTDFVDQLIDKGADINWGLIGAAVSGNRELAEHLIEKGADALYGMAGAAMMDNIDWAKELAKHSAECSELGDDDIDNVIKQLRSKYKNDPDFSNLLTKFRSFKSLVDQINSSQNAN